MDQTFEELIADLRLRFQPRGSADIVLVHPGNYGFVQMTKAEVTACIDELEKAGLYAGVLGKLSPLQALGARLLLEGW